MIDRPMTDLRTTAEDLLDAAAYAMEQDDVTDAKWIMAIEPHLAALRAALYAPADPVTVERVAGVGLGRSEIIEEMARNAYENRRMDHDGVQWELLRPDDWDRCMHMQDARAFFDALAPLIAEAQAAGRAQGIEEAAQVADTHTENAGAGMEIVDPMERAKARFMLRASRQIVASIRSLSAKPDQKEEPKP